MSRTARPSATSTAGSNVKVTDSSLSIDVYQTQRIRRVTQALQPSGCLGAAVRRGSQPRPYRYRVVLVRRADDPQNQAGGGRDRVLIGRILTRRLRVTNPPPVSVQMAHDIGGYQSGLTLFRQDLIEPWVAWFAHVIAAAATRTTEVLDDVAVLQDG